MINRIVIASVALIAASPVSAGVTEQALARCIAAAQVASPGAVVSNRKIVEGGRNTLISLWVKDASSKRTYDCKVSARGELVAAFTTSAANTALATAD